MKPIFIAFFGLSLLAGRVQDNKTALLSQAWKQVGVKLSGQAYKAVDGQAAELLFIKDDGTYEKILYGKLHVKGRWQFDTDPSKLKFSVTEMNKQAVSGMSLEQSKATDSLLALTPDTLIDARMASYGHDDWYYVRIRK